MYTVYQHINKINGKRYIGITKQNPEQRWGYGGANYRSSPHFYNSIKKYGWENFDHMILFENLTKDEACAKEKELILEFDTMNRKFGYNSTSGGECFVMSGEAKIKKSKSMIGNKNGLGKVCSEEKKLKISESNKGKKRSDEAKRKMSEKAKLRHIPCSDEKREALRNSYPNMKKVYCVETDTVYKSVQECSRLLNVHATNISKVCKGKLKSTNGYHFTYYNSTINA